MRIRKRIIMIITQEMGKDMSLLWKMLIPVAAGFVLDLILGDPVWLYHPVRIIGHLISGLEKIIRSLLFKTGQREAPERRKKKEYISGATLVVIVLAVSVAVPALLLRILYRVSVWTGLAAETFLCYQLFAVKSLKTESDKVYQALTGEGLEAGRRAVSMIVGRDTEELDEKGVIKAAVETVAENTSDGIVAPMFYMVMGGAVLGFAYKAINTMDSMVGYKNEKYQYFGTAAARLDDVVNYLPARLSAWLMIVASFAAGYDGKNAYCIYRRDRHNHKSPNSAQTESVMAGALGIQLAGNAYYFGKLYEKPTIGDAKREVEAQDIRRSHRLLYGTAWLALLLFLAVQVMVTGLLL